ncbi:MAG: type VI secretion system tube protein Hcp [Acidobacteriota bacterium]|nr:type VI secretion system tube protein Hcp [Acidobacteriota bacterium]
MTFSCFASIEGLAAEGEVGSGRIALVDFNYEITMPTDLGDGSITGLRRHGCFTLVHQLGAHSLAFTRAICRNQELPKVTVTHYHTDPDNGETRLVFTHELHNAKIVGIQHGRDGERELETVRLMFDEITFGDAGGNSFTDRWDVSGD